MADYSPTIIAASLNDEELKKSIDGLVTYVNKKMGVIGTSIDDSIEGLEQKLKGLGNKKSNSFGESDGGSSRRKKSNKEEEVGVDALSMSYDKLLGAVQMAEREVRKWEGRKTFSTEDLDKYQSALARVVELNEKLRQEQGKEAFRKAEDLSRLTAFDARANVGSLFAVDERLTQLNKYYKELETQSAKVATATNKQLEEEVGRRSIVMEQMRAFYAEQEKLSKDAAKIQNKEFRDSFRGAMSMPVNDIDEARAKIERLKVLLDDMKSKKDKGIINVSEADINRVSNTIAKLSAQIDKDSEKRLAAIEKERAAREKMIQGQRKEEEKYQNSVLRSELGKTIKQSAQSFDEIQGKLERLKTLLANIRDLGFLTPKEITSAETEITKLTQKVEQFREALQRVRENEQRQNALDATVTRQQAATIGVSGESLGWGDVNQQAINSRRILASEQIAQAARKEKEEYSNLELSIASLIGVKASELNITSSLDSTYSALSSSLRQMSSAYEEMTKKERDSAQGKELANAIQETGKAINDIQKQKMRPISLDKIIGFEPKNLDDIAYKIQMLQRYRSGIDITKPNASKELDSVNKAISELNKKQRELLGTNKSLLESNNALARSWNYMKNRLAFYVTVGASTAFVKNLIEVRSQYEMNERALGILVDSAARGTRIFNELSQMSLVSPYTLIELSTAAKQLTAYDIAAKDVVDTTRRLADMAAAVGAPVERLTYALGQIKAYGYLNSRDARMFANAGIPLVKQLAEYYTELEGKLVSAADVYDRMKKKAIDFNAVMAVVNKMTDEGGKFFDFQAKMADTLKVRLANLTLAWNNMLNAIGKDTNGILTTSIKGLAELFKHWRSVSRILGTVVTALGAYKAATWLAAITTSTSIGKSSVAAWLSLASSVRSAKDATALFSLTIKSIPFVGWVTAIASLVSWFYLFNQSGDEVKQKLQDIQSAFDGVRKEVDDLFADAIRTDSIGTQLTKLQSMLETAETELGIVIPINLEDVNESNIKQKLKEARNFIDTYLNFSQTFSEAAAGSKFNEVMNEFGANARTVYTSISESINTVVVALRELSDKANASKRDIEILNELTAGQKEDESRIEYLQRLISLYEELGLIGKKEYTPNFGISAIWRTYNTNMEDLQAQQEKNIERLGIKNKSVFESMLNDVQGYYSSSQGALSQFEKQIERVAQKIDINSIPIEQRTLRLQVAINEEASLNNWNEFEKEYARQIANTKYGTQIEISSESKNDTEADLQDWQKRQQEWMDNHGIKVKLSFRTDETEESYASRMLQAAKDAQNKLEIQKRKLSVGTGSQEDVDKAIKDLNEAIASARAAGADLSQLDKNRSKSGSKKDILGDALTKELQLITDIQKLYKEYTKAGVDSETAKTAAAKEYQKTLEQTNATLSKFGIQGLTGEQIATMDLRTMRDTYQSILDKVQSSPKAVEALEKAIRNLNVEITKEGQKTIIDSLNSELSKIKDEYELAIDLDANPELGGVFADMMGLSKEELEKLPRDFEGVVRKLQTIVDKKLGMGAFDVRSNLNKDVFDQWVKSSNLAQDSEKVKALKAITDYANKVRQDETKKQIEDWNKLLEKYAEYEYKRTQIIQEAERERETARKKGAPTHVMTAIDMHEAKELAKVNMEEFQASSEWITATGDLVGLTDEALGLLIKRIEEFKKSQKHLDAKQIKQLNNALKQLYQQQRKGNPFLQLSNAIRENKMRREEWSKELEEDSEIIEEQNKRIEEGTHLTEEETKTRLKLIDRIKELKEGLATLKDVTPEQVVDYLQTIYSVAGQATGAISDMMKAFGNSEDAETIGKVMSTLEKGLQFAQMGAAIGGQTAGGWGAVIGGIIGLLVGGITAFADEISGNADITKEIQKSERAVKRLSNVYEELSWNAKKAYGAIVSGLEQATVENKKLQLAEMERQLELEKSRSKKRYDEDRVIELEGEVENLRREIKDATSDIVNELLGISSAGDEITNLVQVMIDAFRNGEDAMEAFGKEWDKMIDNMILKLIVSEYMKRSWDNIMKVIEAKQQEFFKNGKADKAAAEAEIQRLKTINGYDLAEEYVKEHYLKTGDLYGLNGLLLAMDSYNRDELAQAAGYENAEALRQYLIKQQQGIIAGADAQLERASQDYTEWTLDYMMHEGRDIMMSAAEGLKQGIDEYYDFGELAEEQQLSALQQGIQGITEDTAGALEAMLNGISQQVYLHSDILIEIRDVLQSFDYDVRTGVQAQILLELQTGFQTVNAMRTMMENWQTAAGNGIKVEIL